MVGGGGLTVGGAIPGRVQEGGTPPAQLGGMGERCKFPRPQKPALFALENPPKLCSESIITDPAFIFSMRCTTVHSFRKYDNDGKIHYIDTLFMHLENMR